MSLITLYDRIFDVKGKNVHEVLVDCNLLLEGQLTQDAVYFDIGNKSVAN
jgi:hypothetical protein